MNQLRFTAAFLGISLTLCATAPAKGLDLKEGDVVFQTSLSHQSQAVQLATHSPYSHMGIVFSENGQFYVFEAEQHVVKTPFKEWVKRGRDGKYVVKRLKMLDPKNVPDLKRAAQLFKGRPYDLYFEWSDDRVYCSELVWKIYQKAIGVELGPLRKLKDFDLSNPVVMNKLHERYGATLPLEQPVISPADVFNSPLLLEVGNVR